MTKSQEMEMGYDMMGLSLYICLLQHAFRVSLQPEPESNEGSRISKN
jgi:hypothetical protein